MKLRKSLNTLDDVNLPQNLFAVHVMFLQRSYSLHQLAYLKRSNIDKNLRIITNLECIYAVADIWVNYTS